MRFALAILFFVVTASSATKYCRADASGAATGNNWTDAYTTITTLESNLARGDTGYIADGTYNESVTFNTATSGTTLITVKKATTSDHGTETGWTSTFGDGQAEIAGTLTFSSDYWTIDGQSGGGPSGWKTGFGFFLNETDAGSYRNGITVSDGVGNITAKHMEIAGHGPDADAGEQDLIWQGTGNGPCTYSYFYLHDSGRTIFFNRKHNTTYEYVYTGAFQSTEGQHSELASIWIDFSHTKVENVTFRWSIFTHAEGTGGIIAESDNLAVYGCVFAPLDGNTLTHGANALVGIWSADSISNLKVYNNTFINSDRVLGLFSGDTGNEFKNNLVYNSDVGNDSSGLTSSGMTHTHNYYVSLPDGPVTEPTQQTGSGDPFVDWANLNFGLTENSDAGTDLGSPYNVDLLGNTRTTWTRGAFEYQSGGGGGSGQSHKVIRMNVKNVRIGTLQKGN